MISVHRVRVIAALATLAFLALPLTAGPQGRVLGTVTDQQGEPIADATVTLTGRGWEFVETFSTNKKGRFTATVADATRDYHIHIGKDGYIAVEGDIDVAVGEAARYSWTLAPTVEAPVVGVPVAVEAYNRGAGAFNAGDSTAAVAAFRQALDLDPDLTAARATLAKVLFDRGDYEEAAEIARQWMADDPASADAVALAFDSLIAANDAAGAAALVEQIGTSGDPDAAKRIFNAGAVAVSNGNRQAGIELMSQAVEVDPALVEAHSNLARLHAAADAVAEAERHARAALELAPQDPGALITLFDIHQRRGEREAALEFLEVMKGADPGRAADILGEQAAEYINLGRLEVADELSNEALKLDHDNAKALLARASLALNQNNLELARERLQAVIDAAPDSAQAQQAREMLDYL